MRKNLIKIYDKETARYVEKRQKNYAPPWLTWISRWALCLLSCHLAELSWLKKAKNSKTCLYLSFTRKIRSIYQTKICKKLTKLWGKNIYSYFVYKYFLWISPSHYIVFFNQALTLIHHHRSLPLSPPSDGATPLKSGPEVFALTGGGLCVNWAVSICCIYLIWSMALVSPPHRHHDKLLLVGWRGRRQTLDWKRWERGGAARIDLCDWLICSRPWHLLCGTPAHGA